MEIKISLFVAIIIAAILGFSALGDGDTITFLDSSEFGNPQKPASDFDHDFHILDLEIECNECHHLYENGVLIKDKGSEDKRCSECHPLSPTGKEELTLMKAFHLKCEGCHEEKRKGPIMCGHCHKK